MSENNTLYVKSVTLYLAIAVHCSKLLVKINISIMALDLLGENRRPMRDGDRPVCEISG